MSLRINYTNCSVSIFRRAAISEIAMHFTNKKTEILHSKILTIFIPL